MIALCISKQPRTLPWQGSRDEKEPSWIKQSLKHGHEDSINKGDKEQLISMKIHWIELFPLKPLVFYHLENLMLNPILSPNLLMTVNLCSCQDSKASFSCFKCLNAKNHDISGKRKKPKSTTAATKNQTQTPEILIRKTNMVQMAYITQAEKKTKLNDTSHVWGFGGWLFACFWEVGSCGFLFACFKIYGMQLYIYIQFCAAVQLRA